MANILMGQYEIYCNRNKTEWRLWDELNAAERTFNSLEALLDYCKDEMMDVEIEAKEKED